MDLVDDPVTLEVIADEDEPRRVRLIGELDLATADSLVRELDGIVAGRSGDLVLDMRELSFVDSTGIRALIGISNGIREGALVLEAPRAGVRRVLELVRADSFPNLRIDWE
jgi:anti-anti-sigma factor